MTRKILRFGLLASLLSPAFAGQSLLLTPGMTSASVTDPNQLSTQAWRVEFELHGWTDPTENTGDAFVWDMNGIGANAAVLTGGILRLTDKRDSGSPSVCDLPLAGRTNVLVRVQREPASMRYVCEMWNYDASGYQQGVINLTSFTAWPYSGGRFGSPYTTAALGFYRVFDSTVPDASRPPTTAGVGDVVNLTFDGNTLDTSGKHNNTSFPAAAYRQTPNQTPASLPKVSGSPSWTTSISFRAGFPGTLDGSASFSLADGNDAVTYQWQQVSGPTTLRWSVRTGPKPIVQGMIFGDYRFRLAVTDVAGQTSTADLDVGAVATDDNGVVVQANPAADILFGPMIAFGKNPWTWQDDMAWHSASVRAPEYAAISPPGWAASLPGTVTYSFANLSQSVQTTLAAAVAPGDLTITVASAAPLDLTSFPTLIKIHSTSDSNDSEEIQICSASGNVLAVCYDGRGWRTGLYQQFGATAWPSGPTSLVEQVETLGSGTNFLAVFCPAGPGEEGQIVYNAASVSATAGSTALTGGGTAWNSNFQGDRIRISGTHGGVPWAFYATVSAVNSANSITLSRAWPSDADTAANLSYAIIQQSSRYIARGWNRPDGSTGKESSLVSACESDTRMYQAEILLNNTPGVQSNQSYGFQSGSWFSELGPNYYDEVLAHYAGYFRSGNVQFLNNARAIGDYWPTDPEFDEDWLGQLPRHVAATGMLVGAVLDGRTSNWYTLRRLANQAITGQFSGGVVLSSCDTDVRENAYGLSWLALAALFDPVDTGSATTPNQRSYWKAQLANAYTRFNKCKGPNNEFPQPYWGGTGSYTMTQGSATVTAGQPVGPSLCNVVTAGTLTVSNGSVSASDSAGGFLQNAKIVILGQRFGQPYMFYSLFTANSQSSITMASAYDGDSGTYRYQIETDTLWLAFAADLDDYTNMNILHTCTWNNSTTITLDRPWTGASGVYGAYRFQELGYGQEPFLAGINVWALNLASQGASGATASNFVTLANAAAAWILGTGFDPVTGGLHYAREWPGCEPNENPRMNCTYATDVNSEVAARTLNGEAQNAMRVAYVANPTPTNLAFGDQFYGAQWGKPGYGGPYSDGVYLIPDDSDSEWSAKWLGFQFGIGMSHQWPAVRVGGVQPAIPVTPSIAVDIAGVPGAASVLIKVTQPSSAVAYFPCSTSPCQITADARQGAHWYQIEYLNAQGGVITQSAPDILAVSPPVRPVR